MSHTDQTMTFGNAEPRMRGRARRRPPALGNGHPAMRAWAPVNTPHPHPYRVWGVCGRRRVCVRVGTCTQGRARAAPSAREHPAFGLTLDLLGV
jgi:hypothetical protein